MAGEEKNANDVKGSGNEPRHEPESCPRCSTAMIETHCKVICTSCGYMRDCNDQW